MGRVFDFVANSGDGVFAVDSRQSIVLWNSRATATLGYSAEEVLGKKCYGILSGRNTQGCIVCRRGCETLTSGRRLQPAPTTEIVVQTKKNGNACLNITTVVVPSPRGDLSALVFLFREVTQEYEILCVANDLAAMVSGHTPRKRTAPSRDAHDRLTDVELTPRERELLKLLASGKSTNSIAEALRISPRTVRNHVNNILGKLDVHSRLEAVAYAMRSGLA